MEITRDMTCRACLAKKEPLQSIFLIYRSDVIYKSFAVMLEECTDIKICIGDGLPEVICQSCIETLIGSYNFKQQCVKTDITLKEYLTSGKIEQYTEHLLEIDNESNVEEFTKDCKEDDEGEFLNSTQIEDSQEIIKAEKQPIKKRRKFKIITKKRVSETTFEKISMYNKHKKLHESELTCMMCDMMFSELKSLNRHVRVVHKYHMCNLCDRIFKSPHGLKYHMDVFHNGVKAYQCSKCDKRFGLKQALIKHEILHTDVKNFLCTQCGKAYATYDSLHYHLNHHQGERPHLCTHCGKTFIQACHLKNHMWTHTGIKPHICKTCGKCYTSSHQLKKHWRKYCGNLPQGNEEIKPLLIKNELKSDENVLIVGIDDPDGNFAFNIM